MIIQTGESPYGLFPAIIQIVIAITGIWAGVKFLNGSAGMRLFLEVMSWLIIILSGYFSIKQAIELEWIDPVYSYIVLLVPMILIIRALRSDKMHHYTDSIRTGE